MLKKSKVARGSAILKVAEGSLEQKRQDLCEEFCKWLDEGGIKEFDNEWWAYPIATFDTHLIVEGYGTGKKWKVPYKEATTDDGDGDQDYDFGPINYVSEVYIDKSAKTGATQAPEFEIHAPITKSYIAKSEDGTKDFLWIEGCATADVIDLDGEVVSKDCHIDFEKAVLSGEVEMDSEHSRAWNATFGKFTECRIESQFSEELQRDVQLFLVKGYADLGYSIGQDLKKALIDDKRTDIGFSIAGLVSKDTKGVVDGRIVRKYEGIDLKKISITGNPAVTITWVGAIAKSVSTFYTEAKEAFMKIQKTAGAKTPAPAQVKKTEGEQTIVANNGGSAPAETAATLETVTEPAASTEGSLVEKATFSRQEVLDIIEKIADGAFKSVGGGFPGWTFCFPASVATGANTLVDAPAGGANTLGDWSLRSKQEIKSERVLTKADGSTEVIREFYPVNELAKTEAPAQVAVAAEVSKTESTNPELELLTKRQAELEAELVKTKADLEKVNSAPVGAEIAANGIGDPLAGIGKPATEALEVIGKTEAVVGGVDADTLDKYTKAKASGDGSTMIRLLSQIPLDKR